MSGRNGERRTRRPPVTKKRLHEMVYCEPFLEYAFNSRGLDYENIDDWKTLIVQLLEQIRKVGRHSDWSIEKCKQLLDDYLTFDPDRPLIACQQLVKLPRFRGRWAKYKNNPRGLLKKVKEAEHRYYALLERPDPCPDDWGWP